MKFGYFVICCLIATVKFANADYRVSSELEGWFCSGWVFEKCTLKRIDALSETENGELFGFAESFQNVDEYDKTLKRCWLNNSNDFHAFERNVVGEFSYLGVPRDVTFQCEQK